MHQIKNKKENQDGKRSKILSVLMVMSFMSYTLAGCGNSDTDTTDFSVSENVEIQEESGTETKGNTGLPDVELKNKKIVVYNIADNLDGWRGTEERPGVVDIMEKEYGAEFEVVAFSDWGKQYEMLATRKMSNDMPDLLMQCDFPVAIANGLCQPTEDYIDYSNPNTG